MAPIRAVSGRAAAGRCLGFRLACVWPAGRSGRLSNVAVALDKARAQAAGGGRCREP